MLQKLKTIEIKRSKYGDIYALVNGKLRYQSPTETLDLHKIKGTINVKLESHYGDVTLLLPDGDFTTTQLTGWWDLGVVNYPYFPNLRIFANNLGSFALQHWKDGLIIASSVMGILKTVGILAYPQRKLFV